MSASPQLRIPVYITVIGLLFFLQPPKTACQEKKPPKTGIIFTDKNWQTVLTMAGRQHKPIFIDAFATWCAPCKELKARTFRDQAVAAYFNRHYINVSLDVEKGEGLKLAEQYDVSAYPTLLFLTEEGKLISKSEGFVEPKPLLELVAKVNK